MVRSRPKKHDLLIDPYNRGEDSMDIVQIYLSCFAEDAKFPNDVWCKSTARLEHVKDNIYERNSPRFARAVKIIKVQSLLLDDTACCCDRGSVQTLNEPAVSGTIFSSCLLRKRKFCKRRIAVVGERLLNFKDIYFITEISNFRLYSWKLTGNFNKLTWSPTGMALHHDKFGFSRYNWKLNDSSWPERKVVQHYPGGVSWFWFHLDPDLQHVHEQDSWHQGWRNRTFSIQTNVFKFNQFLLQSGMSEWFNFNINIRQIPFGLPVGIVEIFRQTRGYLLSVRPYWIYLPSNRSAIVSPSLCQKTYLSEPTKVTAIFVSNWRSFPSSPRLDLCEVELLIPSNVHSVNFNGNNSRHKKSEQWGS